MLVKILLRFFLAFLAAFLLVKLIKNLLVGSSDKRKAESRENIIDICPNCGELVLRKHRCPPSPKQK